ncbi:hypothetical protein CRENBAI_003363 [Crenichthys baileyi]|uniref:Uncharacterized protein n=1 Tax=Crenichthys baileyi TaxID=28760 RepID=A0AAV9S9Q4_9TELE
MLLGGLCRRTYATGLVAVLLLGGSGVVSGFLGCVAPGLGSRWASVTQVRAVPALVCSGAAVVCLSPLWREGGNPLGPGSGCTYGVLAPRPGSIEYLWGV